VSRLPDYSPEEKAARSAAVTSLVLALAAIIVPFGGLVMAPLAVVQGRKAQRLSKRVSGMAAAGIILGGLLTVIYIVILVGFALWGFGLA